MTDKANALPTYRIICSWRDDHHRQWGHYDGGQHTDRRDAYTAFHAETGAAHLAAHDLIVELIEYDPDHGQRTLEKWPGIFGAQPVGPPAEVLEQLASYYRRHDAGAALGDETGA
jgi:hypothetical protein